MKKNNKYQFYSKRIKVKLKNKNIILNEFF